MSEVRKNCNTCAVDRKTLAIKRCVSCFKGTKWLLCFPRFFNKAK